MKNSCLKFFSLLLILGLFVTQGHAKDLSLVGEGIRKVFALKIYNLQFSVSDLKSFDKKRPLESLKKQKKVLIKLQALMTMKDKKKLTNSLEKALKRNKVDTKEESIKSF